MVQVIKYKCCDKIHSACIEPDCYTSKEWLKDMRKYVLEGDKVAMVENTGWRFGKCECQKELIIDKN